MQLLGGVAGGGSLGGVGLGLPQPGDRFGQRGQVRDKRARTHGAITGGAAGHREQPRGGPQPVPVTGAVRAPARLMVGNLSRQSDVAPAALFGLEPWG
jgi:hypothetical protein